MRVEVDRDRCVGAGMCSLTDPEVFDQEEADGTVVLLDPAAVGHEKQAREAAQLCPSGAIRVVG